MNAPARTLRSRVALFWRLTRPATWPAHRPEFCRPTPWSVCYCRCRRCLRHHRRMLLRWIGTR